MKVIQIIFASHEARQFGTKTFYVFKPESAKEENILVRFCQYLAPEQSMELLFALLYHRTPCCRVQCLDVFHSLGRIICCGSFYVRSSDAA